MQTTKYYRNTDRIVLYNNEEIDEGSLWEKNGEILVLVDDDRYIEHEITSIFKEEN